jgi:hypothetical protein
MQRRQAYGYVCFTGLLTRLSNVICSISPFSLRCGA